MSRASKCHHSVRYDSVLSNQCAGTDYAVITNLGTIHDNSPHPNKDIVSYATAMNYGTVTYSYIIANSQLIILIYMKDSQILYISAIANSYFS